MKKLFISSFLNKNHVSNKQIEQKQQREKSDEYFFFEVPIISKL